jgi:hypothetical protein
MEAAAMIEEPGRRDGMQRREIISERDPVEQRSIRVADHAGGCLQDMQQSVT